MRFASWNLAVTWWYEILLTRIGLSRVAERTRAARMQRVAQRFHALAVDLGGLMIKVGQYMSSRLDVLPPQITEELAGLQDEVPPVPFEYIRELAEAELGVPLDRAFAHVEETPVAAASLGQAHRARLSPLDAADTGLSQVIVKVQRPGIDAIVDVDLAALRKVGGWLSRLRAVNRRVDLPALIEEFARTSREEINYLHEAANAERFAEAFEGDERVSVPAIAWERTSRRVLTLEDVTAIKISDLSGLRAAGIDPAEVAHDFAEVMYDQLFGNGFFHADPHPGNVFVTPTPDAPGERSWRLTFIDFGMMGELPNSTRGGLRQLLIAAATRDGKGLVQAGRDLGVLLPSADTVELERVLKELFARFGGMGFAELRDVDPNDFREFAVQFNDVVRTLPIQLPGHFLLVGRAMSLTSGVCSTLNPAYNLWDSVEPYAAQLLREESSNVVKDFGKDALEMATVVWGLPNKVDGLVSKIDEGRLAITMPQLERRMERLENTARQVMSGLLFAALLFTGATLRHDDPFLGNLLMIVSVLPLMHALFSGRRRR
ncbi:ABC1 kinase family protein [Demequina aurantiaca]|uniref:ABC1 kinase family protein n=1 Tax=Demequina aurantiaca TaxID=676200 RepID=UPI000A067540|nr:AarF/UbiB family protein [Demequina aurantiaca]